MRLITLAVVSIGLATAYAGPLPTITPIPQDVTASSGVCRLTGAVVQCAPQYGYASQIVTDALREAFAEESAKGEPCTIHVGLAADATIAQALRAAGVSFDKGIGSEGYLLAVRPKQIALAGRDAAGVRWGAYTLAQIIRQHTNGKVPCLTVRDWPDFPFRGEVFVYLPKDKPERYWEQIADLMAAHKMNYMRNARVGIACSGRSARTHNTSGALRLRPMGPRAVF